MSCGGVYELHPPHTLSPLWRLNLMTLLHGDMAKPQRSEACVRGRCGGAGGNDDSSWSPVWLFPFPMKGNSSYSSFFIFIFFGVLHKCGRHLLFANSILLLFTKKERRQMSLIPFQPSPYFSLSCCLVSITHLL